MKKLLILLFPLLIFSCEEEKEPQELSITYRLQGNWLIISLSPCGDQGTDIVPGGFEVAGSSITVSGTNEQNDLVTGDDTFSFSPTKSFEITNLTDSLLEGFLINDGPESYDCFLRYSKN